jgi:hypothetical protein
VSRPAGPVRRALLDCLAAGMTGTYDVLAGIAGVEPGPARATLKEIRRGGQASARCRQRTAGRASAAPAVYGHAGHESTMDALGFVRQVWR